MKKKARCDVVCGLAKFLKCTKEKALRIWNGLQDYERTRVINSLTRQNLIQK